MTFEKMNEIKLRRLRLLNFKGIRSFDGVFEGNVSTVSGKNAAGKTTLVDAFTWLLFGKDSKGKTYFDIKTLDADGNAILHLPHEVEAVIEVDGTAMRLRRRYIENWCKEYGAGDILTGHTTEYYCDDVPLSKREYEDKIEGICDSETFSCITNPLWFNAQTPEKKRGFLLRMAGEISTAEIIGADPKLSALPSILGNCTDNDAMRAIAANKKALKEKLRDITAVINRHMQDMSEYAGIDYAAIEKEMDAQVLRLQALSSSSDDAMRKEEISALRRRMRNIRSAIAANAEAEREARGAWRKSIDEQIAAASISVDEARCKVSDLEKTASACKAEIGKMEAAYAQADAQTFDIGGENFVCPLCHRPLEMEAIEAKVAEMEGEFNLRKARELSSLRESIDVCRKKYDEAASGIDDARVRVSNGEKNVARLRKEQEKLAEDTPAGIDALCAADDEYAACQAKLAILEKGDNAKRDDERRAIEKNIEELRERLQGRALRQEHERRVAELQEEYHLAAQDIAKLAGEENVLRAFRDAKMRIMESRVNGMFAAAKFKLWDTQLNGVVKETCEATFNGVPYSSLNSAARTNLGIDIINAVCSYMHVTAPIFVDNAESINKIADTKSQIIRLVVTADDKLIIT